MPHTITHLSLQLYSLVGETRFSKTDNKSLILFSVRTGRLNIFCCDSTRV